jgi:uncharacterized protein (DUF1330 family)
MAFDMGMEMKKIQMVNGYFAAATPSYQKLGTNYLVSSLEYVN